MPTFVVPVHERDLREHNDCHVPAGSPQGGQFCSGGRALSPRQARLQRKREQRAARWAQRKKDLQRTWPKVALAARQAAAAAGIVATEFQLNKCVGASCGLSPTALQRVSQVVTDAAVALGSVNWSSYQWLGDDRLDRALGLVDLAISTAVTSWPVLEQTVRASRLLEAQSEPALLGHLYRLRTALAPVPARGPQAARVRRTKVRLDRIIALAEAL